MRSNELSLDEVVAAAFEAERAKVAHPPIETLVGYHAGDLEAGEADAVREHLTCCAACTEIVLDWHDFPDNEPADPALRAQPGDEDEDWCLIERRIAPTPDAVVMPLEVSIGRRPSRAPRLAAAATISLALLGLSFWMGGRLSNSGEPRANIWAVDLAPVDQQAVRSNESALAVPADMGYVLFFLNGASTRGLAAFSVELVDAAGSVSHRWPHLVVSDEGNFTVEIPRRDLPAGTYRLRLSGEDAGRRRTVAEYSFSIDSPRPE